MADQSTDRGGMRHRTYERHVARIETLTQRCLRETESRFGREALATLIR